MAKFRIYNDTLCPDLWDTSQHLDPEVRLNLLKMAYDFYKKTKFVAPILDVWLMGSSANFNWTPDSDVDVHIIIDFSQLRIPSETASKVAKSAGAQWNKEHNITVKGHKVEINIQSVKAEKPYVQGIYSLVKDAWVRKPSHFNVQIDKVAIQTKFLGMKKYVEGAIRSADREQMKKAKDYLDAFRQYGLDNGGELSVENIVYKILRAKGLVNALKDAIIATYDKEMTVTEKLKHQLPKNTSNFIVLGVLSNDGKIYHGVTTNGSYGHVHLKMPTDPYPSILLWWRYRNKDKTLYIQGKTEQVGRRYYTGIQHFLVDTYNIHPEHVSFDENEYLNKAHLVNETYPAGARFGLGAIGSNDDVQFKEFPRDTFSNQSHGRNGNPFGRRRFRYLDGTVEWSDCGRPEKEQIDLVNSYLERKGFPVKKHTSIYDDCDIDEVTHKDLRARHPQSQDQWNIDWSPRLSKMTLDNLKAMRDKIDRGYRYAQQYNKMEDIPNILAQYKIFDDEIKKRLAYINDPVTENNTGKKFFKKQGIDEKLIHSFEIDYGRGPMYVEVFKNPSTKELRECKPHYEIGALLTDKDIYVWNREKAYHNNVKTQLKLSDPISLILIPDNSNITRMDILVTDSVKGTKWNNNPQTEKFIRNHSFFNGKQIDHIMYWNEDIVGNWSELNPEVSEGYGSGIPEIDRLHITGRRWQIRNKDVLKTPKMKENFCGDELLGTPKPYSKITTPSNRINFDDKQVNLMKNIAPEIRNIIREAERMFDKKHTQGLKFIDYRYAEEVFDYLYSIYIPDIPKTEIVYEKVKDAVLSMLAIDYDIRKDGKRIGESLNKIKSSKGLSKSI